MTEQTDPLDNLHPDWLAKMQIIADNLGAIYTVHLPIVSKWATALKELSEHELTLLAVELSYADPYNIENQCKRVAIAILHCKIIEDEYKDGEGDADDDFVIENADDEYDKFYRPLGFELAPR